jgi:uncharacterized protein
MTADAINDYLQLRQQADQQAAALAHLHGRHLVCRAGCTDCCTNLTVLPVEFEAIRRELAAVGGAAVKFDAAAPCGFLTAEGLCAIYPQRPIICRTHGLPIAFADEDDGHNVSFCEQNFTTAADRDLDFGPDNTLDLDDLNERLARINLAYLAGIGLSPARAGRVELRKVVEA